MTDCGERDHHRGFRSIARIIIAGALLCLLSFAWFVGHSPAAHASGVPYCGKLTEEHAPTRPAIHLNRTEGPVGTNLTATVSGWRPGAQVSLRFDAREPKTGEMYILIPQFAQGTVANDGTITTAFARRAVVLLRMKRIATTIPRSVRLLGWHDSVLRADLGSWRGERAARVHLSPRADSFVGRPRSALAA